MRPFLLAVATALVLVGCGSGNAPAGSSAESGGAAADMAARDTAAEAEGATDGAGFGVDEASVEDRDMIVEGTVSVTVTDPRGAAQTAVLLVERLGGRVSERSEEAATEHQDATARLVVRVPAGEVTAFIDRLDDLGSVGAVETTSTDVTMQARDLDARIRAMELSVSRLEEFMARATTTEDLLDAERTLTERQAELESMQSQRTRLADRVDLSTLTVNFWTPEQTPVQSAGGFSGGLETGWTSLVTALGTALLVTGVLLPWLALAGVVALAVMALRRRGRRSTPPPPPAAPVHAASATSDSSDESPGRP